MVRSNHGVVSISINGFTMIDCSHHGSMSDRELSLALYIQDKNISRKLCIHNNILSD